MRKEPLMLANIGTGECTSGRWTSCPLISPWSKMSAIRLVIISDAVCWIWHLYFDSNLKCLTSNRRWGGILTGMSDVNMYRLVKKNELKSELVQWCWRWYSYQTEACKNGGQFADDMINAFVRDYTFNFGLNHTEVCGSVANQNVGWWRHQIETFSALLALCEGNPLVISESIDRSTVDFPYKGQWRGALMFSLICARTNGWANNRNSGDLRRLRAHYDVTVMGICRCGGSIDVKERGG